MNNAAEVLRRELMSEDGFLLKLRTDLSWDRAAFTRLDRAMRAVCEEYEGADQLDRDLAEGFHALATWVPEWTSHPNFPRPEPESYYTACLERLSLLAYWFFTGGSPYIEGHIWEDL
ncbi:hypothetical protein ACWDR2_33425 [Streptomyces sp. NPDC003631]